MKQLTEISKKKLSDYIKKADVQADYAASKNLNDLQYKRENGINTAWKKMNNKSKINAQESVSLEDLEAKTAERKAKWHYARAGTVKNASFKKGIENDYKAQLLKRGVIDHEGKQKSLKDDKLYPTNTPVYEEMNLTEAQFSYLDKIKSILNEVSKQKLSAYVKKAVPDYGSERVSAYANFGNPDRQKHMDKMLSRRKGIEKALDKLTGAAKVNSSDNSNYGKQPIKNTYGRSSLKPAAILPTGTSLHPDKADKNEYHSDWKTSNSHYGYHEKIEGPGPKTMIVMGHSKDDKIGEHHHFKHDQTGARIGEYKLKHIVHTSKIHELPYKSSHSLYTYK